MLYRYLLVVRFALVNLVAAALLVATYMQGWLDGVSKARAEDFELEFLSRHSPTGRHCARIRLSKSILQAVSAPDSSWAPCPGNAKRTSALVVLRQSLEALDAVVEPAQAPLGLFVGNRVDPRHHSSDPSIASGWRRNGKLPPGKSCRSSPVGDSVSLARQIVFGRHDARRCQDASYPR